MGEEGVYIDPGNRVDVEYLETMFFDGEDDDLYLVYKDGTVEVRFVDWSTNDDVYFCDIHESYQRLPEKMTRYESVEGADFGFLCGDGDAYQIDMRKGDMYSKRTRIRGYLTYDAAAKTLYLHDGRRIYTSPLYSPEETVNLATTVLSESSYWNYFERWPYH